MKGNDQFKEVQSVEVNTDQVYECIQKQINNLQFVNLIRMGNN